MDPTVNDMDWPPECKAMINRLKGENQELRSENDELKMQLASQNNASQSGDNAHEQFVSGPEGVPPQTNYSQIPHAPGNLQHLHNEFFERSDDLTRQLEAANQKIVELESKLEKKEQIVDKAVEQVAKLDRKLEESQKEIAELKGQVAESNERVDKAIEQADDLQEEIAELKSKLAESDQINQELDKQIKDSNDQRNQIVKDLNKQGLEKNKKGQYQDALELRLKAIEIEETGRKSSYWLGVLWNNVSVAWSGLKRYDKALETVEKAIAYNPSHAIFYYNRGDDHEKLGHREQAISDFKKQLSLIQVIRMQRPVWPNLRRSNQLYQFLHVITSFV